MKKKSRVNSADPEHRALIARQDAARKKGVTAGKIKTHFRTRSGKLVANPSPTGMDDEGRPIFGASTPVLVHDFEGNQYQSTARKAARDMNDGDIPIQRLVAVWEDVV